MEFKNLPQARNEWSQLLNHRSEAKITPDKTRNQFTSIFDRAESSGVLNRSRMSLNSRFQEREPTQKTMTRKEDYNNDTKLRLSDKSPLAKTDLSEDGRNVSCILSSLKSSLMLSRLEKDDWETLVNSAVHSTHQSSKDGKTSDKIRRKTLKTIKRLNKEYLDIKWKDHLVKEIAISSISNLTVRKIESEFISIQKERETEIINVQQLLSSTNENNQFGKNVSVSLIYSTMRKMRDINNAQFDYLAAFVQKIINETNSTELIEYALLEHNLEILLDKWEKDKGFYEVFIHDIKQYLKNELNTHQDKPNAVYLSIQDQESKTIAEFINKYLKKIQYEVEMKKKYIENMKYRVEFGREKPRTWGEILEERDKTNEESRQTLLNRQVSSKSIHKKPQILVSTENPLEILNSAQSFNPFKSIDKRIGTPVRLESLESRITSLKSVKDSHPQSRSEMISRGFNHFHPYMNRDGSIFDPSLRFQDVALKLKDNSKEKYVKAMVDHSPSKGKDWSINPHHLRSVTNHPFSSNDDPKYYKSQDIIEKKTVTHSQPAPIADKRDEALHFIEETMDDLKCELTHSRSVNCVASTSRKDYWGTPASNKLGLDKINMKSCDSILIELKMREKELASIWKSQRSSNDNESQMQRSKMGQKYYMPKKYGSSVSSSRFNQRTIGYAFN